MAHASILPSPSYKPILPEYFSLLFIKMARPPPDFRSFLSSPCQTLPGTHFLLRQARSLIVLGRLCFGSIARIRGACSSGFYRCIEQYYSVESRWIRCVAAREARRLSADALPLLYRRRSLSVSWLSSPDHSWLRSPPEWTPTRLKISLTLCIEEDAWFGRKGCDHFSTFFRTTLNPTFQWAVIRLIFFLFFNYWASLDVCSVITITM